MWSQFTIQNSSFKISIVMPCYNAEASVERAVRSIQSQSLEEWELIVVDDGSTDKSANLVEKLRVDDHRIQLVRQSHRGVVAASNAGFELATSPLIARMDADDVSLPDRLKKQSQALETQPELGAVSCLARFAGDHEAAGGYAHHVEWTNRQVSPQEIALNRFIDLPVPHPTLMYRRQLVEKWGGYREGESPEDYELFLRWVSAGVSIGKVNEVLYDWHDPPTRLSRNDSRYNMAAFHACKAPYLAQAIVKADCSDRELWIWGAGRPARKCARPLESAWKPASGFIDIDPRKIGRNLQGRPIISSDNLPPIGQTVIVSYVGTRGARDIIRADLRATGRIEGVDFWICA